MLELTAGVHPAPKAGLQYELASTLRLPRNSCLFLLGDNGVGKTTFLEEIFIPVIRLNHRVLYLAQDMDLQQNTIRATLALLDRPVPATLTDMVRDWILASPTREVIVLDEFDKYWQPDLSTDLDLTAFGWAVSVSHLGLTTPYRGFAHGYGLAFARKASNRVTLTLDHLW
jgi:hypothetical protein